MRERKEEERDPELHSGTCAARNQTLDLMFEGAEFNPHCYVLGLSLQFSRSNVCPGVPCMLFLASTVMGQGALG